MASGKKNYFRHSFFARNDIKLLELRELVGVGFYFYYFSLLEQCGEQSESELKEKYVFHNSTIRKLWSVNLEKCRTISTHLNAVGLLEFKKLENSFEFTIPNLAKYLGRYESKFPSNSSNKIKENKIKENKIKQKEKEVVVVKPTPKLDFESIYAVYPRKEGKKKGMEKLKREINSHEKFTQLQFAVNNYAIKCKDTETRFIKLFSSFASTWEDYLEIQEKQFKDFTEDDALNYFEAKIAQDD